MSPFSVLQVGILRDGEAAGLVSGDDAESARLARAVHRGSFLFPSTNGERPAHGRTGAELAGPAPCRKKPVPLSWPWRVDL